MNVRESAVPVASEARSGLAEFRYGWKLVLAATVGVGLGLSPIPFYEIGLIAPELAREFNWPIATIMGGIFFMMLGVLIMAPIVGWLSDRFGVRVVTLTSITCFGLSLSLFAFQTGSETLYYATWFLMAVVGTGTLPITWTRTVNQSFDVNKGLALGLVLTGTGLSSVVLKPAVAYVIAEFGWPASFLFLAALPLVVALPLAWFFFHPVEISRGDGHAVAAISGKSLTEALGDWRFWIIVGGILLIVFAVTGVIANLEIILRDRNISTELILSTTPFLGVAIIAGRLFGGWLIDRLWAPAASLCMLSVAAAAVWMMGNGPVSYATLLFSVIGIGLAAGVEFDLLAYLAARYFGLAHYGSIYGAMYLFFTLGAGSAPYVFGRVFDTTDSYQSVLDVSTLLILAGAVLFLALGPYQYGAQRRA